MQSRNGESITFGKIWLKRLRSAARETRGWRWGPSRGIMQSYQENHYFSGKNCQHIGVQSASPGGNIPHLGESNSHIGEIFQVLSWRIYHYSESLYAWLLHNWEKSSSNFPLDSNLGWEAFSPQELSCCCLPSKPSCDKEVFPRLLLELGGIG